MLPGFKFDRLDFIEFLASAPCTKAKAQEYLESGFNVRVPRTSYELMWDRLEEQLGTEAAADAVCEVVAAWQQHGKEPAAAV